MFRRTIAVRTAAPLLLSLVAAACGGTQGSATATVSPTSPPAAASGAAPTAAATPARVSANSASHAELVAALTAAGVLNADRWASEIEEYRPYDAADTTLAKLQQNLAKYNPDPATLTAILSALQP